MAGSLHIAWGIWVVPLSSQFLLGKSEGVIGLTIGSFYLAAIVGSLAGAILVTRLKKDIIYVTIVINDIFIRLTNIFIFKCL